MGTSKMAKAPAKKTAKKKAPVKKTVKKAPAKKSAKKAAPAKKSAKKSAKKTDKKDKVKRAPSAYNLFMKSELAKVKKANPKMDHKEAFTAAAKSWSKQKK